jgi:hypothetical protein
MNSQSRAATYCVLRLGGLLPRWLILTVFHFPQVLLILAEPGDGVLEAFLEADLCFPVEQLLGP